MRKIGPGSRWVLVGLAGLLAATFLWAARSDRRAHAGLAVERVLIIGGSAARGWRALHNVGYLDHAFRRYGLLVHVHYRLYNHAIPGAGVRNRIVARHYTAWLRDVSPGIVVLAWGTLNDLRLHTTETQVAAAVADEARQAVTRHNVVLLVTPIPTRASYTIFRQTQPLLIRQEVSAVSALHNPNTHVLDLYDAMRRYLTVHDLTYRDVMHDRWDPNALGHRLAGQILVGLLRDAFHDRPMTWVGMSDRG